MATILKASEVGSAIYEMLVEAVETEFTGESEAAKQEAISRILGAFSVEMFK